jgi:hypothetical protein
MRAHSPPWPRRRQPLWNNQCRQSVRGLAQILSACRPAVPCMRRCPTPANPSRLSQDSSGNRFGSSCGRRHGTDHNFPSPLLMLHAGPNLSSPSGLLPPSPQTQLAECSVPIIKTYVTQPSDHDGPSDHRVTSPIKTAAFFHQTEARKPGIRMRPARGRTLLSGPMAGTISALACPLPWPCYSAGEDSHVENTKYA